MPKVQPERIQKVLARLGVASRRRIEELITEGRITVNGTKAELGQRITPNAKVMLDRRHIRTKINEKDQRLIIYHKPAGEVTTRNDPERRPTVFDNLPVLKQQRWIAVGRLDFNTSGLLLFTTDGELANQLMHPSACVEREYSVRVFGEVDGDMIKRLRSGVPLEDGDAKFDNIKIGGGEGINQWYHVTVTEGRNRLVRRLWESQGVTVSRLIRIRYGEFELPRDLKPGETRVVSIK